jgi:hypothetical protein
MMRSLKKNIKNKSSLAFFKIIVSLIYNGNKSFEMKFKCSYEHLTLHWIEKKSNYHIKNILV